MHLYEHRQVYKISHRSHLQQPSQNEKTWVHLGHPSRDELSKPWNLSAEKALRHSHRPKTSTQPPSEKSLEGILWIIAIGVQLKVNVGLRAFVAHPTELFLSQFFHRESRVCIHGWNPCHVLTELSENCSTGVMGLSKVVKNEADCGPRFGGRHNVSPFPTYACDRSNVKDVASRRLIAKAFDILKQSPENGPDLHLHKFIWQSGKNIRRGGQLPNVLPLGSCTLICIVAP